MKLQGLQVLGGEIWVSRIKFTGRDRHFTIWGEHSRFCCRRW